MPFIYLKITIASGLEELVDFSLSCFVLPVCFRNMYIIDFPISLKDYWGVTN